MKTLCCNSSYTRIEKLKYECDRCKKDVTLEIMMFLEHKSKKKNGF